MTTITNQKLKAIVIPSDCSSGLVDDARAARATTHEEAARALGIASRLNIKDRSGRAADRDGTECAR